MKDKKLLETLIIWISVLMMKKRRMKRNNIQKHGSLLVLNIIKLAMKNEMELE